MCNRNNKKNKEKNEEAFQLKFFFYLNYKT